MGQMKTTNLNRIAGLLAKVYTHIGRQTLKARCIDDCCQSVSTWSPLVKDNKIVIIQ
jgi:hypothetical protein